MATKKKATKKRDTMVTVKATTVPVQQKAGIATFTLAQLLKHGYMSFHYLKGGWEFSTADGDTLTTITVDGKEVDASKIKFTVQKLDPNEDGRYNW